MKSKLEKIFEEYELKRKISKCLYAIEMKTSSNGFCYWLNAISYCISKKINEEYDVRSISEVYKYIAKKYEISIDCVEKSMRYSKERSGYKEHWQITDNLKNHDFLQMCTDRIVLILFHK